MYVHIRKEAQTFKGVSVSHVTCSDYRYIMPRCGLVAIVKLTKPFTGCHIGIISTCLPQICILSYTYSVVVYMVCFFFGERDREVL